MNRQSGRDGGVILKEPIVGVRFWHQHNHAIRSGVLTEIFNTARDDPPPVPHNIVYISLSHMRVTPWNVHDQRSDFIICLEGSIRLVLYDERDASPTQGRINVFYLSRLDPVLYLIPPGVWHALKNESGGNAAYLNFFDRPFTAEAPDIRQLDYDSERIPYDWR